MLYFVEQWKVTKAWKALTPEQKKDYMSQVNSHIGGLLGDKVKILTWSKNAGTTSMRADYDYFAIWSFADQENLDNFQKLVENAGWYNYFAQTNLSGEESSAETIINEIIIT